MSYEELPSEHPSSKSWESSVPTCLVLTGVAGFLCIIGNQGALGEIGAHCPPDHWSTDYAHQFFGGGGEGYLREYLGELGILFFFLANAVAMIVQAEARLVSSAAITTVFLLVFGQVMGDKLLLILCPGVLLAITVGDLMLGRVSDHQHMLRRVAICGGLVVFLARQTVHQEGVSPFWPVMFGRFVLLIPILQGAIILRKSGFQSGVNGLGFPCPSSIGLVAFLGCILGCIVNIIGAMMSSFMCELVFTLHLFGNELWIIVAQVFIPGVELQILFFLVYTCFVHIWPFLTGPSAERMHHFQEMIEFGAVIGGLTYLTGSDVWSL